MDAIEEMVHWLGWTWDANGTSHLFFASNYFDFMYRAAEYLITAGLAYVDEQTPDEMRARRGDFGTPGTDSPFRSRTPEENLARFREMRDGKHADGAMVLRAKIDMASPNINMRDPALYRIRRATPPQHRRRLVHLPDVHLCAPDRGCAGESSRTASARSSSRTSAPSTTGCSNRWPTAACWPARCPSNTNSAA